MGRARGGQKGRLPIRSDTGFGTLDPSADSGRFLAFGCSPQLVPESHATARAPGLPGITVWVDLLLFVAPCVRELHRCSERRHSSHLYAFVIDEGMKALDELLERDREVVCGPAHHKRGDRQAQHLIAVALDDAPVAVPFEAFG